MLHVSCGRLRCDDLIQHLVIIELNPLIGFHVEHSTFSILHNEMLSCDHYYIMIYCCEHFFYCSYNNFWHRHEII